MLFGVLILFGSLAAASGVVFATSQPAPATHAATPCPRH